MRSISDDHQPHHALRGQVPEPHAAATLDELWRLAREASATGRFRDLERLTAEASSLAASEHGEVSGEHARALAELAYALRRQGKYLEAEPVLRRLVEVQERLHGPDHPSLGLYLDLLAAAVSRAHPGRMSEVKKLESRAAHVRLKRR